jgi:transposase
MTRWAYQSPIKRAPSCHVHHFGSEFWGVGRELTDKTISGALKSVGENRESVMTWHKRLLPESSARESFILMDSTHVMSASEHLEVNSKGYNNAFDFGKQLRLMYLFSARMKLPVYYRLLGGNIVDIAAMALCVKEMGVSDVVYIADKGFYSRDNVAMLEERNLKYIMPVRRSNPAIDYGPIGDGEFKIKNRRFVWQGRVIWYYQYEARGYTFITYLDDRLRVEEEQDYLARITTHPDTYTEKGYQERLRRFGTLTLTYRMNGEKAPDEVYMAYKQRNEIEMMFDSYKSFMKADVSYMQNRYVLEGWLFTNFIAMLAYYKLYSALREMKLLSKYSPKDIIEMSKTVYKVRIRGTWYLAEVTAKVRKLLSKAKIDYLN